MLVVTQVIIGSDREMCRLLQLLSHELCLVLPGTSAKWTVNDDGGVCAIFLVCTRETVQFPAADVTHTFKKSMKPFK